MKNLAADEVDSEIDVAGQSIPARASDMLFAPLGANAVERTTYRPDVVGKLPSEMHGTLYRNGPGLFTRGGRSKAHVLDGDGLVQRLAIADGEATYARRFVRTKKFVQETNADRFIYPTWTTRAPGLLSNVGQRMKSQAGITVYQIDGRLLALDEVSPAYEVDTQSLETVGTAILGLPEADSSLRAHVKCLSASGDWLFASTRMGRKGMEIDLVRHRRDGSRVVTPTAHSPRLTYVHDFAATERHAVFILHAVELSPLRFISGFSSFRESLSWRPSIGNLAMVIDLATGASRVFEAPASWWWHVANAYEQEDRLLVDFVGYDDPGHFLGGDAQLAAIMHGHDGIRGPHGTLRRYIIDFAHHRLEEIELAGSNFEFPSVAPLTVGVEHESIFASQGTESGMLHTGVARLNVSSGVVDSFDFGPTTHCGEPVFAKRPGGTEEADGWLIVQVLEMNRGAASFAVLDARHVHDGPLATIELEASAPISFHGMWLNHPDPHGALPSDTLAGVEP